MTARADLVVRDGTLATPRGALRAGVAVTGGVIVAIGHEDTPGDEHKEDWESGTTAAAFGGVTTVLDMPNTRLPTATAATLARTQERAARRALVDYGIMAHARHA